MAEVAVIDPSSLSVSRTIPTPALKGNHPLRYDAEFDEIVVAGTNGIMTAMRPNGAGVDQLTTGRFDQCDLDASQHILACAGDGGITRIQLERNAAPHVIDVTPNRDGSGDFIEKLEPK